MRRGSFPLFAGALIASASAAFAGPHDALIAKHAAANGVPEQLVHRVVRIESGGNAAAAHRGNYGLMQIRLATARGVGYSGDAQGLLDPDTNLTYAVRYLAGAYRAAGCDADRAVSYYQRGYYGAAKRECGESPAAAVQMAQAETKPSARSKRGAAPAKTEPEAAAASPPDVIKPKVVRTESIAKPGLAPSRPVGNFEPARAPPPAQPAAIAHSMPPKQQATSRIERPKPDAAEPAAKIELASVPMPPVRPEFESAPMQTTQPVQRVERVRQRPERKSSAEPQHSFGARPVTDSRSNSESKIRSESKIKSESRIKSESKIKFGDPGSVVTFLKNLVTPDKKPSRAVAAQAVPRSQAQPPR
jgi:hypothetical protein